MKTPLLLKKAIKQADYHLQNAHKAHALSDCFHDLMMWIDCKVSGKPCEVTDEEAQRFIRLITEGYEGSLIEIAHCNEWLKALQE